jgi:hypothetical protein
LGAVNNHTAAAAIAAADAGKAQRLLAAVFGNLQAVWSDVQLQTLL